ncbi:aminotransferase class V-fold PLP-dependent enzyme [Kitasatospora cineracea]|uniref:Selenocysteine lyase/cysteine desulfurase n=1 Tax=Kitasatospora cineracea TaxID=88074 RepID=A0A3N4RS13_9ACTN|nr:aminotransferase class V-fold PLP-dependent enzyme [Kitasatospora cineracea]RPE36212.1 selenocysteine lyase/cysteine desulfurase [Kitasatospora cineracea]
MAGIDVERVRRETAGVGRVVHLDNAGAALQPRAVVDAVVEHLRLEEEVGGYEAARRQAGRIERTYDALAGLIGAGRDDIALVENATRAWDMAFYALPWAPGDRILTARAEYASNAIAFLQTARRHGVSVETVPDDADGQLDVDALRAMVDERVRLIAVTHVPTQGGLVNPAAEIGRAAREAGAVYLLDACQSVGQLPLDVGRIGCDLLTAPGRKFLRGPRGTGFLYCSPRIRARLEPPFLDLHAATWTSADSYRVRADARRFESWEANHAARIGLGVAAEYALALGPDAIAERATRLGAALRERLRARPGVRVHDRGARRCALVTFTVEGRDSQDVAGALRAAGVNVSVSLAEYARWDFDARSLASVVRASPHYYNTEAELDRLVEALPAPVVGPTGA